MLSIAAILPITMYAMHILPTPAETFLLFSTALLTRCEEEGGIEQRSYSFLFVLIAELRSALELINIAFLRRVQLNFYFMFFLAYFFCLAR
jgi:hypothetical protein